MIELFVVQEYDQLDIQENVQFVLKMKLLLIHLRVKTCANGTTESQYKNAKKIQC